MDVLVVADGHYYRNTKGEVYVESVFDYKFYQRYLSVFDKVYAMTRMEYVNDVPEKLKLASGANVEFLDLPATRGSKEIILNYSETIKLIRDYITQFDCAIFRIPGAVANIACKEYAKTGKHYAVEVIVDPWEYFAKGTVPGLTGLYARYSWTRFLKKICLKANGTSYVTDNYLQNIYPCRALKEPDNPNYFTGSYSSVELPDDQFGEPRTHCLKDEYIISHVANAFTGYGKGHIVLMDALKILRSQGYNVRVVFVGDGPLKEEFAGYAKDNDIDRYVTFTGRLPDGAAVREKIKDSDMFVFPTRAEGLPRVVLEAMAEGLPVVSSPVCGIPEIISSEWLVDYDNPEGYADAVKRLIDSPKAMDKCSRDNLATARKYRSSVLAEKRKNFYSELKRNVEHENNNSV